MKGKGDNVKKAAKQLTSCLSWRQNFDIGIYFRFYMYIYKYVCFLTLKTSLMVFVLFVFYNLRANRGRGVLGGASRRRSLHRRPRRRIQTRYRNFFFTTNLFSPNVSNIITKLRFIYRCSVSSMIIRSCVARNSKF